MGTTLAPAEPWAGHLGGAWLTASGACRSVGRRARQCRPLRSWWYVGHSELTYLAQLRCLPTSDPMPSLRLGLRGPRLVPPLVSALAQGRPRELLPARLSRW